MQPFQDDIRSRLQSARLPVMPQILLKLVEACQSDDAGMGLLAKLIAQDPGMTSKVLGIANSSAYHRGGRPVKLEQSLAVLGVDLIRALVINESAQQVFNNLTHANGTDLRAFWKHSLAVAVLAKDIAGRIGYPNPEEAYLAGLLHDIGRLALLASATKEYAFIFFAHDDNRLIEVENSLLHLTHTEAGAILADRWHLDSFLSDSLLYHHQPESLLDNAHPLVRIVILAHRIASSAHDDPAMLAAAGSCGIAANDIVALQEKQTNRVQTLADVLGVDLSGADDLVVPTDGWEIAGRLAGLDEGTSPAQAITASEPSEIPLTPQEGAHRALAEEMRNVMLTNELRQTLARPAAGETETREAIARSARILFGFSDVVMFRKNAAGDALVGTPISSTDQRMAGFTVKLDGNSRLSQAAREQQLLFVPHQDDNGLAEKQLMRLFACDALVGLPIGPTSAQDSATASVGSGMLIGGTDIGQLPALRQRERFLRTFGALSATALNTQAAQATAPRADAPVDTSPATSKAATNTTAIPRKIVHESNNALSIIKNYLGVLDAKLDKQQIATKEIAILHDEVDRVGRIINGLANPESGNGQNVSEVNTVIRNVVQLFRDTAASPSASQIVADTQDTQNLIACAPEALKQILINLVKNAIEAAPENGKIQVINDGIVNRDGQLHVALGVKDDGPGIPQAQLASLFSPTRTTKGGTHQGLGLSIVHDLVKQAHGLISCRSNPRGTSFEILFPVPSHPAEKSSKGTAP